MKIVIFSSPERKSMLTNLLNELGSMDVSVIDSTETFGKDKFWMRMKEAVQICIESKHDNFMIMPDDVTDVQIDRITEVLNTMQNMKYIVNIINDGRVKCWGSIPIAAFNIGELIHSDYCDCGFITNRKTLSLINVLPVHWTWFDRPDKSSGVGYQLTMQMRRQGVLMYTPKKSLVYHGEHDSVMHYAERKRTPLISK